MKKWNIAQILFLIGFFTLLGCGTLLTLASLRGIFRNYYSVQKVDAKSTSIGNLAMAIVSTAGKFYSFDREMRNYVTKLNFLRTVPQHVYSGAVLLSGRRIFYGDQPSNSVVYGPNDFLYYYAGFGRGPEVELEMFQKIVEYGIREKIPMLQVLLPNKQLSYKTRLPNRIHLPIDREYGLFLTETAKILYPVRIDAAAVLKNVGARPEELYYRTDHHWTPLAALATAQVVAAQLHQNGILDAVPGLEKLSNYEKKTGSYRSMFGDQGVRIGRYWVKLDTPSVYLPPENNAMFTVVYDRCRKEQSIQQGPYLGAVVGSEETKYGAFFGGADYLRVTVENHAVERGKLLVIQDSLGRPFTAYLALFAHRVVALDPRFYTMETLLAAMNGEKFDAIIYLRSAHTLGMLGMQVGQTIEE